VGGARTRVRAATERSSAVCIQRTSARKQVPSWDEPHTYWRGDGKGMRVRNAKEGDQQHAGAAAGHPARVRRRRRLMPALLPRLGSHAPVHGALPPA
jgi:hypothetical protein